MVEEATDNKKYAWIEENIISKTIYPILNIEASKYSSTELYSEKRLNIQNELVNKVTKELKKKNLIVISCQITAVDHPPEYRTILLNKN